MKRALVIGRGVQGRRWIMNLQNLDYIVEAYGRDFKEKSTQQYYDIIVVAVPHYAFLEVSEELARRGITARKVIIEKPGASNYDQFMRVRENLNKVGYAEMFLPLYIQYGFRKPRVVRYLVKLDKNEIKFIDKKREVIVLRSGREIDLNILRDLFWHPASLYRFPFVTLEYKVIHGENLYTIYALKGEGYIYVGRHPKKTERKIDGENVEFENPMKKQLEEDFEMLALERLPMSIWLALETLLKDESYSSGSW